MTQDDRYAELLKRARAALSIDATPDAKARIETRLERLASELLLEWIVGDRRFESQGQQTEYWLYRIYDEIFFDEQPESTRIYERFTMSLPRAGYVARLLRARRTAQWRTAARAELRTQLNRFRQRAEADRQKGTAHIQEYDLSLSAGAADELRVMYDRISEFVPEHERPKPPKVRPTYGNSRWLGLPAETLLLILERLDAGERA